MKLELSQAILKATDPKLRTDNWQANIEVCDIVKRDPEDNGKDAIAMLQRRLEQNDANVLLRSLSLTVALAENCGSRLQQEISSKSFTNMLYSLIEKRTIHITVKIEIVKMISQLSKSFKSDPSLRSMNDTYKKIKKNHPELLNTGSSNETSRNQLPSKNKIGDDVKQREQKELEEALKLSLQEFESQKRQENSQQNQFTPSNSIPEQQQQQQQQAPRVVKKVRAMYDLNTSEKDELSFKKGDIIIVLEQVYRDWWRGSLRGNIGIFPLNYVTPIVEPTQQELLIEKQKEDIVFQQYDKINRLHSTLKNSSQNMNDRDITQDEEVTNMYGSVTPLRPEITKMIGKYAREKDDMTAIYKVLNQAEQTYNQLLDQAANAYKPTVAMSQTMPPPIPSSNINYPQQQFSQQQQQPLGSATGYQQGYPVQTQGSYNMNGYNNQSQPYMQQPFNQMNSAPQQYQQQQQKEPYTMNNISSSTYTQQ
ncbi:ESCRT-0 subunit protein hse1 [Maudiozyma exigua]|uniref:Class E vacuolar protein-sorting machinery protein HSE1 n=1 Tax=Maudiozyma exigua TaxID=34358 RepID=A0A9P6W2U4_MAUEX|nr:ESCRT-0 subunit protein hse1 [Kazachstania exigua]